MVRLSLDANNKNNRVSELFRGERQVVINISKKTCENELFH